MMSHLRRTIAQAMLASLILLMAAVAHAAAPAPTIENAAYGPHERNVLDLWQAKSDKPTPLIVFIHGGGFVNGDKSKIRDGRVIAQCLERGVSFASINYRFRQHAPIQDILRDAARAIQFLRSKADVWNLDPRRIASYGGSAGAGTSLWLAFHDDLADPTSDDPVLRQSSRLTAAGSLNGQMSYDLREWEPLLGPVTFQNSPAERWSFYGFRSAEEVSTATADKVMKDCSMLGWISPDDPPVAVACAMDDGPPRDRGYYLHHPKHSTAIAERAKQHGVECLLLLREDEARRGDQQAAVVAFLLNKLLGDAPSRE